MEVKNFHPPIINPPKDQKPIIKAEPLILGALQQLQAIYNKACKAKKEQITIERTVFESIGKGIQEAYESIKQACNTESKQENTILNALTQIQSSVTNLEKKYDDIETKIMDTPKTYSEIIRSNNAATGPKIEQKSQRQKQNEALREEREKLDIHLTTKNMSAATKQEIMDMSGKEIAERCQKAIDDALPFRGIGYRIQGVSKLANEIRIKFDTEQAASRVCSTLEVNWDTAFPDLKIHVPSYGIVVHGVPINELNTTTMADTKTIEQIETGNNIKTGTITKITPLRRRDDNSSNKAKRCHSIVLYSTLPEFPHHL